MNPHGSSLRSRVLGLFAVDLRSLALFRIALGALLLLDLATRAPMLATSYSDLGAHPRAVLVAYHEAGTLPSLHLLSGAVGVQAALFAAAAIAALLLAVGWHTRLASFASWLLLDSLHERNALVLYGGDPLLRLLLFWSIFLPLGARASLDALRRRGPPSAPSVCTPASAALLLQVACVFFVTGLLKTGPEWTRDGTAVHYAINRSWQVRPLGEWLLANPQLPALLTPAVLWFERLAPPLLFLPVANAWLRLFAIPGFWALLAGFGLGLRLGFFPWIGAIAMLPFVPSLVWDALGRRFQRFRAHGAEPPSAPAAQRAAHAILQAAVLGLLAIVLWINAGSVDERLAAPPALRRVASFLHLEQHWSMYAPGPKHLDVWLQHRGRLRNGTRFDLDRTPGGEGWKEVERAWRNFRFEYSLQKMAGRRRQQALDAYAQWLCRQWNLDRSGGARLESLSVDRVVRRVPPPGEPEAPHEIRQVASALCPR